MKILITAFEPFGEDDKNASLEVLRRLEPVDGCELVKITLPVIFGKAAELANEVIDREDPDAVILLGQAGGRRCISLETTAVNVCDTKNPDNEGNTPENVPVVPGGKATHSSSLPLGRMKERLKEAGIPAELSNSAGTYVCNSLMYGVLYHLDQTGKNIPAGFIHVPYFKEQTEGRPEGTPYMELEDIAHGIGLCIECAVKDVRRKKRV